MEYTSLYGEFWRETYTGRKPQLQAPADPHHTKNRETRGATQTLPWWAMCHSHDCLIPLQQPIPRAQPGKSEGPRTCRGKGPSRRLRSTGPLCSLFRLLLQYTKEHMHPLFLPLFLLTPTPRWGHRSSIPCGLEETTGHFFLHLQLTRLDVRSSSPLDIADQESARNTLQLPFPAALGSCPRRFPHNGSPALLNQVFLRTHQKS